MRIPKHNKAAQPAVESSPGEDHAGAGSGLLAGGQAHSAFDDACCILKTYERTAGQPAGRQSVGQPIETSGA